METINKKTKFLLTAMATAALLVACGGGGGSAGTASGTATVTPTPTSSGDNTGSTANPADAVSVVIGSGDKIETTAQDIKYRYRYAVTVRDKDGLPVKGAVVSVTAQPTRYFKGVWGLTSSTGTERAQTVSASCSAEDVNNNNVLDTGEDTNGDGILTPEKAQIVTIIEDGVNETNSQGIVYVIAEHNKSHATWFEYTLTATAAVTGTEGTAKRTDIASYVAGDQDSVSIPFARSPYGVSSSCDNAD